MGNIIRANFMSQDIYDNFKRVSYFKDYCGIDKDVEDIIRNRFDHLSCSSYFGRTSVSLLINDLAEHGYYIDEDFTLEDIDIIIGEY